jgi:hypothetical protein
MVTLTNPRFLARQAEAVKAVEDAIQMVETARQHALADVVANADGESMSVDEALEQIDKVD